MRLNIIKLPSVHLQRPVVRQEEEGDRYRKHDSEGKALQASANLECGKYVRNWSQTETDEINHTDAQNIPRSVPGVI